MCVRESKRERERDLVCVCERGREREIAEIMSESEGNGGSIKLVE